mmetsp:Transcript_65538/g.185189  ORF Transcript_65538/g.185189 Transcript_65538/m.185189 type:complete len:182 (+) Transcript_65538:97-642(+)
MSGDEGSEGRSPEGANMIARLAPQLVPWFQWPEIRRVSLTQRHVAHEVVMLIYQRYLTNTAPTSISARLDKLGMRLNCAQAAQSKGSPDATAMASGGLLVLEQSAFVLAQNCENYADLFEHVGFTIGDELDPVCTALLDCIERITSFRDAVIRLREHARAQHEAGPRMSSRVQRTGAWDDD